MATREPQFKDEILQMMHVAGETLEPSAETVALIENIVHDQVVRMLITSDELARRRGHSTFSNDDLIFQFRRDHARIARVRNFLAWKTVRKTAKDSDDKDSGGAELPAGDQPAGQEEEEAEEDVAKQNGRLPAVHLPWDLPSYFSVAVPDAGQMSSTDDGSSNILLDRLRRAEEVTRTMTVSEYKTWSEYRRASFTHRKLKFRQWSGLGVIAEHRPTDDVLDILGLLTSEMVQKLTAEALRIQLWELSSTPTTKGCSQRNILAQRTPNTGLFAQTTPSRPPIGPSHVRRAFQTLQNISRGGKKTGGGTSSSACIDL